MSRELLERAARAAGLDVEFDGEGPPYPLGRTPKGNVARWWNPLKSGDDLLELIDRLRMLVDVTDDKVSILVIMPGHIRTLDTTFREGRSRKDTLHYAVVRAACEMA